MNKIRNQEDGRGRHAGDERGFVLILALVMLAILSILATILMNTSTTELKIVNNYQSGKQAFYAVERAVEYSTNRNMLLTMGMGATVNLMTADAGIHRTNIDAGSTVATGGGALATGTIQDLLAGDLPAKLAGGWGSEFGANQYRVQAAAVGPGNSQARVESVVVRIYKGEDDSVFRTTGGG